MKPRILLLLAMLLACAPGLAQTANRPKYNVLFIASDDMRPELGTYGNKIVKTPNLDRLASWGVRFDQAYVQYPLCNPSRASMLTGRYPMQTGVLDNRTWFGAAHPDFVSLPKYFKQNGYASLRTGKIFHGGIDDTDAWTEGGEKRNFEGATNTTAPGQNPQNSDRIVVLDGNGESHPDYRFATRAIEYLEKYKDQPFLLMFGLTKPHSPPTAPKRMIDMYDVTKMPLPVDFMPRPTVPSGFPKLSVPPRNSDLFIGRDASEAEAREVMRAYYASISFADYNVGRVLEALERLKLRDNTIIVFWGDHGYHLGEKGKWSKHNSLFEVGTRVPLMVAMPGAKGNGKASPRLVEAVDLFATLADLCGLPRPQGIAGESLKPLLNNPQAKWNQPAYTVTKFNQNIGQAVRTERWRYAEYDDGGAMLFDRQKDPNELTNLATDPAHAKVVREMKALLGRMPR
ncbi:MAG: sulfatase [Blastocatellia bacterium]|nr:sulfatase [Blastocatellia bacterium]